MHSAYLSVHLGHVEALLCMNGYSQAGGEVFLEYPDFPVPRPVKTRTDCRVDIRRRPGKDDIFVAYKGKDEVGQCFCHGIGGYCNVKEARDYFFVHAIDVYGEHQGKNIGKKLLLHSMREMRRAGYRHAVISTAVDNYRAFLFYTNVGFRFTDWSFGYAKALGN
jgi:GNAT superfamily N-acetyltransferase